MIRDLIIKNRSYRRFDSKVKISIEQLEKWIDLARCSASARNMQPLKYAVSVNEELNDRIFQHLGWAGYLSDWNGPAESEQPVAYVAMLHDIKVADKYFCDDGIALQSILLGAVEDGFGGCIIGTFNKQKVAEILELSDDFKILWIIALGKPAEKVVLDEVKENNIKYWRDEKSVHHVPKRSLEELIVKKL